MTVCLKETVEGRHIYNVLLLICLKFISTENLRDGKLVRKEAVEQRAVQWTKGLGSSVHRLSLRGNKPGGSPEKNSPEIQRVKNRIIDFVIP